MQLRHQSCTPLSVSKTWILTTDKERLLIVLVGYSGEPLMSMQRVLEWTLYHHRRGRQLSAAIKGFTTNFTRRLRCTFVDRRVSIALCEVPISRISPTFMIQGMICNPLLAEGQVFAAEWEL